MVIKLQKNMQNEAMINIGDAAFYIYDNRSGMNSGGDYPFCDYHIHAGFEIQYVKSGTLVVQTEHGDFVAERGSIIIIPPNNYHQTSNASTTFCRHCFSFSVFPNEEKKDNSEYLFFNRLLSKVTRVTVLEGEHFSYCMDRVIEVQNSDNEIKEHTVYALLSAFLMEMFTELKLCAENGLLKTKSVGAKKFNHFNERQKYIVENCLADHFNKNNTAEIIEQALNTSKRNAARIVYNLFGENTSDLVLKYRMKIAKMYIENTDMNFNQISEKVGYKTYVAFFTAFKKYYGISPKDYKENL